MFFIKITFSQILVLWQTDQMQKRNFDNLFWRFGLLKARNHLFYYHWVNFRQKNPKKQEEIRKKISESCVFASGLFVRALWSKKKWPLVDHQSKGYLYGCLSKPNSQPSLLVVLEASKMQSEVWSDMSMGLIVRHYEIFWNYTSQAIDRLDR